MWKKNVQEVYENLEELEAYNDLYAIIERLGYADAESLWEDNPVISGSTNPKDLKVIKELTRSQIHRQDFVDNEIHWLLTHLAKDINGQHMWNIEDIAKVREVVLDILYEFGYNTKRNNGEMDFRSKDEFEMEFYPFLEEDIEDEIGDNFMECQTCGERVDWNTFEANTGLCDDCVGAIQ